MAAPPYEKIQTTEEVLNRIQQSVDVVFAHYTDNINRPGRDDFLLEDVALVVGTENWVEHGLGRTVRGWRVVDTTAPARVYRPSASTADLTKYLPLATDLATTVSLEVF